MQDLPLWPFKPNWKDTFDEGVEFKTSVLSSPTGSEQRQSHRPAPRLDYSYNMLVADTDRAWCVNYLRYNNNYYWLPIWFEAIYLMATDVNGVMSVKIDQPAERGYKVGEPIAFISDATCQKSCLREVTNVGDSYVEFSSPTISFSGEVIVAPAVKAYLEPSKNGLQFSVETDSAFSCSVKLYSCETTSPEITAQKNGPLIYNGLIVNSWARTLGRGGYFHQDSGTSEGQFIFLRAALKASLALQSGTPEQIRAAQWFRKLAYSMADALGDGNPNGPMLRQSIPDDPNTLCELHWLFAARGDIPERSIVYNLELTANGQQLVIPPSSRGGSVYKVWMIYPSTSTLLYDGTTSPAYDTETPKEKTQTTLSSSDWKISGLSTVITIPSKNDSGEDNSGTIWKVVYGYNDAGSIPITYGYEAFPDWTLIDPYYAACAPDTFRWFDLASSDLSSFDARNPDKWEKLRAAMRRTCIKGQSIDDLRVILEPMAGFDAIPVSGDPTGMYCYSNHPDATTTSVAGANPAWLGYDWWSRDDDGYIVGEIPSHITTGATAQSTAAEVAQAMVNTGATNYDEIYQQLLNGYLSSGVQSETQLYQTQIGRGFSDSWREKTAYQDADWYMYVEVSADRALTSSEHILFYMSATANYDPNTRWFAVLDWQSEWKTDGSIVKLYIPISEFHTRADESVGSTKWGSPLQAGQTFENYGLSVEVLSAITVRLGTVRPISGASKEWVDANLVEATKGSKMPFFPGSLPFAINLNTKNQKFVGWNGSPFHGYQQPDLWLTCEEDAKIVHPDLDPNRDLPIPDSSGGLTFPISATDADGSTRTQASMLCEQQCYFLQKAQEQYHADGGALGPFAHTFVLNTPARSSLGWPTPHTWVYVNDDPNTRWIGYQVRPVESLARLAMLTSGKAGWQTVHQQSLTICLNWLNWFNGAWTSSDQTIFTDYPDPRNSAPQANYDEPHGAALILRACIWLKKIGAFDGADALISRLWSYLERIWSYNVGTNMEGTWSDNTATEDWYGFWHGEIILTITDMLDNFGIMPSSISKDVLYERLMDTYKWLRTKGAKNSNQSEIEGFDNWNGYAIFPFSPNFSGNSTKTYTRNYINFDDLVGVPVWRDEGKCLFEQWKDEFVIDKRSQKNKFKEFFRAVRGQQVPFWCPSFQTDFVLVKDISAGDSTISVKPCGYSDFVSGSDYYSNIIMTLLDGSYICFSITKCATAKDYEVFGIDTAFLNDIPISKVDKISFAHLVRFSSDRLEVNHLTDGDGVATISTIIQSAPEIREALPTL